MRSGLRNLFHFRRWNHRRQPHLRNVPSTSRKMSSSGIIATTLTATISQTPRPGAEPEEAGERRHHLKDGKGFQNPWDSARDLSAPKIIWSILR